MKQDGLKEALMLLVLTLSVFLKRESMKLGAEVADSLKPVL